MTDIPNTDNFGRTVVVTGDGVTDTYSVLDLISHDPIFTLELPNGTDWTAAFTTINAMGPPAATAVIVPDRVTRWQAWSQMLATPSFVNPPPATLFTDVQTIAQASGGLLLLSWMNQAYLYRHGPFIAGLSAQLGLTPAILDQLFIRAAALPE